MRRLAIASTVALATGPVLLLVLWSFSRQWYWPALVPPSWSLRAWAYVVSPASEATRALATSLLIAAITASLSVVLSLPAARTLALRAFPGRQAVLACLALPVVLPPLAAVMGLHRMLLSYGLTDTLAGVALAHLASALPYATLMLGGSFSRLDEDLEAQARTLGAGRWALWRHVTLPAIAPGVAVAFSLAFLVSWSQYLSTLLIGGGHVITLPLELVSFQRGGDDAITAALSLVLLAPTFLVAVLVGRYLRDQAG